MVSRDGRDHQPHRALYVISRGGRMPFAIGNLSGIARRQIPSAKAPMVAIGDGYGPERVAVPGRLPLHGRCH
jgi:hypothetical protein